MLHLGKDNIINIRRLIDERHKVPFRDSLQSESLFKVNVHNSHESVDSRATGGPRTFQESTPVLPRFRIGRALNSTTDRF